MVFEMSISPEGGEVEIVGWLGIMMGEGGFADGGEVPEGGFDGGGLCEGELNNDVGVRDACFY